MRVILEVASGAGAGRKALLTPGQRLKVGRTQWSDFSLPDDGHLSGEHFALQTDNLACYIEDLGSSNGTWLNGQRVHERSVVRDGDEIRAGNTRFVVRAEGVAPDAASAPLAGAAAGASETGTRRVAPPAAERGVQVPYTVETCSSGLTLCRGRIDQIAPAELAARLARTVPLYLIVDFKNLAAEPPQDCHPEDYLFDWLDPATAAMVSPAVVSPDQCPQWPALVDQGWGNDAVVCLFTEQQKPTLVRHLRRLLRARPKREDLSGGIVGFCWPGVMAMLLAHNTPEFVRQLLDGIQAVLVELPDLTDTWQVYGETQIVELLDRAGFRRQESPEAAARPPEGSS